MNPQRVAGRVAVGAITAIFALLALTAMHALPMAAASTSHTPAMAASAAVPDVHVGAMHLGHGDATPISPTATATAAAQNTGGVPSHGHTLLHLCVAVLAVALLLLLAARLRQRPWTRPPHLRVPSLRALLTRDVDPPTLAGLCVLRC